MQAYIVYRYLSFDFIDTLHSQTKSLFKCRFFFQLITSCCCCAMFFKINSKTSQVDQNQGLFTVYFYFFFLLQKSRTFQGPGFYFSNSRTFPVFRDPWEPCFQPYQAGYCSPLSPTRRKIFICITSSKHIDIPMTSNL